MEYRANFGDGTWTKSRDIRDARLAKWGRAGIVQYRTSIEERETATGDWRVVEPSRANLNGPVIVEQRSCVR